MKATDAPVPTPTTTAPRARRFAAGFAVLLTLAGIVLTLLPYREYLSQRGLFEDDQRQHLLPVYARLHPSDYREGFLVNYARHYVPPAYSALLHTLGQVADPLEVAKVMGMGLLVWTYLIGLALGWSLAGPWAGCLTALLLMHCGAVESATFSGLFRSFGFPLVLTFLLGVARKWQAVVLAALALQALFYPPVFLICWLAYAFMLLFRFLRVWRAERPRLVAFACLSAACALLLMTFERKPADFGRPFSKAEAKSMEEWRRKDGRLTEFPWFSEGDDTLRFLHAGLRGNFWAHPLIPDWSEAAVSKAGLMVSLWAALLGAALFLRPRPWWLLAFTASSFAWYFAARHLAYRLGWPDRFLLYTLPVAMILLVPLAWRAAATVPRVAGAVWRGLALAGVFALALVTPLGGGGPQENLVDVRPMEAEWRAARATPAGALFAGWPTDLDSLPLMSGKEPFIDYEHAYPLYRGYYAAVQERLLDTLRLTFSTNANDATAIIRKYGLTHLLVDRQTLGHEAPTPGVFAPYNDMAAALRRGSPPDAFVFNHVPAAALAHESPRYFIVDLEAWQRLQPQTE
jgi:hypothetical protein